MPLRTTTLFPRDGKTPARVSRVSEETARPRKQVLLWLLLLISVAVGANLVADQIIAYLQTSGSAEIQAVITGMLVLILVLYAILIAIPFVPGVEIGLFLLIAFGAPVAPFVLLATITGLSASFILGRFMPISSMCRLLDGIGLKRVCIFMERIEELDPQERLLLITERLPLWIGPNLMRYRYLVIAVGLNVPGNVLIGGGGGIALMAGLSRIFSPMATILTIAVAVSPVALAVYAFGAGILTP